VIAVLEISFQLIALPLAAEKQLRVSMVSTAAFGAFQPKVLLDRSRCYLRPADAAFNVFSRPALLSGIGTQPSHDGFQ